MFKQLYRGAALLAFAATFTACDSFGLEAITPIDAVPLELAITNAQGAAAARTGVYDGLQTADLAFDGFLSLPLYYSDDCDWTGTFPTRAQFDNYNVLPSNGTMGSVWADYYAVINSANNLLAVLPTVEDASLDDATRNNYLAEARFGRAIAYFQLVQGWSDVPLILTPTVGVGEELNVPKSSASDVYDQIIEDATFAAANLNDLSLGMSPAAANALLARVALIQGRYPDANTFATAAIGADYDLTSEAYLEDELFYLEFSSTDGNSNAFFFGPAALNGRYSIAPSADLVAAYEDGDLRKDLSVATDDAGANYGIKYDNFAAGSGSQDDPLYLFRAAEMVLVLAETEARAGNFDEASDWINQVRSRAGLDDVTLTADNFLDLILQERYVELAMEGGHRLWDLRRTGKAVEVFGPAGYEACDNVWPLPQSNIDTNTALEQNACCNC
ncbi:RagB/SusD family nutrient uptake outer membrane protein [Neolewinella agarilytica]|uniref:RagB/SusD family nutrient uptake outer membrane protein n=1 Tax=Neolewinella agarilytica TaxID=478744 RepID=UPI002357CC25|nr:RagB/SusD family nutrient uptake outer membrane protein [Neolewinella agarilytica]